MPFRQEEIACKGCFSQVRFGLTFPPAVALVPTLKGCSVPSATVPSMYNLRFSTGRGNQNMLRGHKLAPNQSHSDGAVDGGGVGLSEGLAGLR